MTFGTTLVGITFTLDSCCQGCRKSGNCKNQLKKNAIIGRWKTDFDNVVWMKVCQIVFDEGI